MEIDNFEMHKILAKATRLQTTSTRTRGNDCSKHHADQSIDKSDGRNTIQ